MYLFCWRPPTWWMYIFKSEMIEFLPWCLGKPYFGSKPFAVLFCPVWSTDFWPSMCWRQPSASCRSCCSPEDLVAVVCRGCWTPEESLYKWKPVQSSQKARWLVPGARPLSRPSSPMADSRSSPAFSSSLLLTRCVKQHVTPCLAGSDGGNSREADHRSTKAYCTEQTRLDYKVAKLPAATL